LQITVPVKNKTPLESFPHVQASILGAKKSLAGKGRVFVRYSGTENIVRILLEGPETGKLRRLGEKIEIAIKNSLG